MKRLGLLSLIVCACCAQIPPPSQGRPTDPDEDPKLPNGKSQRELIVKEDYKKNLEEAAQLAKLAEELKSELEKGDKNVVSVKNIKQTDEIEKLARSIRARLKRY
ncbi:MAG: hypothetical protein LAO79_11045 [Acidobacteriia bacterium]|nr:hypothetical protein [Terriglobia bacterium]